MGGYRDPVALGHKHGIGLVSDGLALTASQDPPIAGGVAIVPGNNGKALVTNVHNDSVSLISVTSTTGQVLAELDLRPGKVNPANSGVPGGEYPFWVVVTNAGVAYISSVRDREIDVVQVSGSQMSFVTRITVSGNPNKMILDSTQAHLYVAEDNTDQVDVINTSTNQVVSSISTAGPKGIIGSLDTYHGFIPNGLTLSPDGKTLYVTNGGINSLAVIDLAKTPNAVAGLIPTGYYPSDVAISNDGKNLYVVNAKSVTGPNPGYFPKNTQAENAIDGTQVAWVTVPELQNDFDPYFRGFDNVFPDFYRETEWEREFDGYDKNGGLPSLELVRFMHDHTGNFSTALDGVNTIELQEADNDYAVGALVERLANSQYKDNTLVFVLEDDAQDGADHVDAHRSIFFVAGPYVKHGAVVSRPYTPVNLLRTIEDILGTDHLNIHTATAAPMAALFDLSQKNWDFKAIASDYLKNTQLPVPNGAYASKSVPRPTHDAAYWAAKTKAFDFSVEDHLGNVEKFNRIVWQGLKGAAPYPVQRTGVDLRQNRPQLLLRAAAALTSAGS
jgi:YVTN family beta-propeller protein